MLQRKQAMNRFLEYTASYDATDERIQLKIDHTLRVAELCGRIAHSLQFSQEDTDLAWLCGLLHDIGRFDQLKLYDSFNDELTIDHAALSADLLFPQGMIREYTDDASQDSLLETAIREHNRYRLSETLTEREKQFCHILRDADKIDILKVNAEIPMEEIYHVTTEELMQSAITPEVLAEFCRHKTILRTMRKTPADYLVSHIALVFELVFPESRVIAREQGYVMKLAQFRSENPQTRAQFRIIKEELNKTLSNL